MKLIVNKDRSVIPVGTWGTKNENDFEILDFEFPEELDEYNKRIVYYLGDERVWDAIVDNKAYITNAITTKGDVKAYVWCTKENTEREADTDFRTMLFDMHFYENENADGIVPTQQQVDGFNTMLTAMNNKIDEVDALETTIETAEAQRQENENARISNESTRESNESTRQTNEQTRQTQEADRERRTNEAISSIQDKTAEYNANAEAKTTAFNNNATQKTNDFNSNYTQKVNDFNTNASSKESAFNSNAETKTNAFNTNATNKTNDFNSNASSKTTAFNENATNKTNTFNSNANDKTSAFNDNATQKTTNFDNNASDKTTDFNNNAQAKTEAFDEHTEEMQQEIDELSANMPWNTTEQATEISVDDAAKYSKNKLELFGNTSQDSTSIDGGDEYDSPSPDHPQPIHVVTGNNTISVGNTNYPINLGSLELCKIRNYQDYLYKENGNWYKYKNIHHSTSRGLSNWTYQSKNKRFIVALSNTPKNQGKAFSNFYINGETIGNNNYFSVASGSGYSQLLIHDERFTTKEDFNAWIENNNIEVYYILNTPTSTQITDETLISQLDEIYEHLQLVRGTNNITVTASDLAPNMELSYMQDLPSKLDNLDSRLSLLE